ncbi:uncharacterized protein LOC111830603 [Capsella rubella]|uniref:uncharacterized protein LOC111830603 n=1 Tax=Capsella rubella TaxID=81985 RepID=UPI000CD4FFA0|nr:uncharacterized protein LOC111830603 [Capsella rubella]
MHKTSAKTIKIRTYQDRFQIPDEEGEQSKEQGYQAPTGPPPEFQPQQALPPQAPDHDMKKILQQILQRHASGSIESAKKFAEMNNKMDCTYNSLNLKIESLTSRMLHLGRKNSSTSSWQLSGKAIHDPKESRCGLGASFSLMPYSVARRLGFTQYKSCNISLILADIMVRVPHVLLEDLSVKTGEIEIPTDFIVLEMDDDPQDPLILGRPFLSTVGAIIDVGRGMINLNPGKNFKMKFDIKDVLSKPTF